jgi:hypothetical protein
MAGHEGPVPGRAHTTSARRGERYLVVSTDAHAGPSVEHQLRAYCPQACLDDFDAFVESLRDDRERPIIGRDDALVGGNAHVRLTQLARQDPKQPAFMRTAWAESRDCPGRSAEIHWLSRRGLWQLMFGGVFERHPGLKIVFTEYWFEHCFLSGSFLAPFEVAARHEVGLQNLMWATDDPHEEGTWPRTALAMRNTLAGIPEDDVRLILGENACAVYDLDEPKLRRIADRIGPPPQVLSVKPGREELPEHVGAAFREIGTYA